MGIHMSEYKKWEKELHLLTEGKSQYTWDEIEELITDLWDDDLLTEEEFETLMKRLMEIDCTL
jgi:hypothetical protein